MRLVDNHDLNSSQKGRCEREVVGEAMRKDDWGEKKQKKKKKTLKERTETKHIKTMRDSKNTQCTLPCLQPFSVTLKERNY